MSILQEYEEIRKDMGATRYDAIGDYLNEVNKNCLLYTSDAADE